MNKFPGMFQSSSLTFCFSIVCAALCLVNSSASADDWGTIKGRFTFGGTPPASLEIKADKDIEVCGKHKILNEELVVGADKGIANVVIFVRDKNVKVHPDLAKTKSEKVILDNRDCRFHPHVAVLQTGQAFVLKNSDTVGHNSNVATIKNPASNNLIPSGGEVSQTLSSDEAIPAQVNCNIHPWMKAWLVVRPNPYATVTAADGSFEIKNLPAGELELQLWHEKAGFIQEFTVGGKSEKVAKGRKKVTITPAGIDLGEMVISAGAFTK